MSSDPQTATMAGIDDHLPDQDAKDQLRFITCGSADAGKSTLLGRLLCASKSVVEGQSGAPDAERSKHRVQGDDADPAPLNDGPRAELEKVASNNLARHLFETDKRKFIAADKPGPEQYTRRMAACAATTDVSVVLVDAQKGMQNQTRRDSYITSLLGIRHVVLAVNKMDLAGWDAQVFDAIEAEYREFAEALEIEDIRAVPISALTGECIFDRHGDMSWYNGPTLIETLEGIEVKRDNAGLPFRMPVQSVNQTDPDSYDLSRDDRVG